MTAECTSESCTQTTVPMIFRWHSPSHCPALHVALSDPARLDTHTFVGGNDGGICTRCGRWHLNAIHHTAHEEQQ